MHPLLVAERGQHDHLEIAVPGPDPAGRLDAVDRFHLEIHQDDVRAALLRVQPGEDVERLRTSARLADDVEVVFAPEKREQPPSHDGVIVDDDHADRIVCLSCHASFHPLWTMCKDADGSG